MTVAQPVALWPRPRDGMVDITDLKSVALGRTGSSPVGGTRFLHLSKIVNKRAQKCQNVQYNAHKSVQDMRTISDKWYNTISDNKYRWERLKMSGVTTPLMYLLRKCMIYKVNQRKLSCKNTTLTLA